MTGPSVLACGLTTLDLVQLVDRVPGPDEKLVASGLLVSSGGPAANAAVTATALGAPARLVSRVGSGSVGRLAAEDLAAHGVALIDLAGPGDSPAVSTVLVTASTGERAVVSVNATLTASGGGDPWHPLGAAAGSRLDEALDGIAAVLVDGHHLDLALPLVAAARARGILVLLDGGSWKPGLDELLAQVDVAVLSADFALPGLSAGESSLERVAALGPVAVARSHGPAPIELLADGALVTVEVPRIDVVDTLGAGDVLHGALLAWFAAHPAAALEPRRAVLADGLGRAAVVAGRSCAAAGARGWLGAPGGVRELSALVAG